MNIQRLRNLTTDMLHTKMDDIYEDLEYITGQKGLMTHMIPRVSEAVRPWLKEHITDKRFWDGKFDITHTGDIDLPIPTTIDRDIMLKNYLRITK